MHCTELFSSARASLMSAASGGAGVSVDFDGSVIIQFVVFLLLFIVLKPILLDPFLKVVEAREKRTDGAKAEARQMDERAGEIIKRYESEMEKVRKVAGEEQERLRSEAQKLEAQILGEARTEAARVTAEGKEKIRKEAESIRFELGQFSGELARETAAKVLGREIS
ncbi:MAG TPA: ATP synthase F0 subunit B [Polyangiaceae bacterium]|nr:MAG: ATP synthase subunit b [Deltaproteobacteria bacterium ADurb.Bin207]HNZ23081.1 ATP synthase F0 subunit B [Polyangiaceae bacterium]HOH02147.1 ATP synthase F0 subunit B [Polyangiaceae bacterium]HPB94541.1 ATP synthase F0 subunit B [Polyangiaceae bacterium]HPY17362.1 ATP synthase F0 subunit B [Polyangiaceae bacterium]